MDATLDRTRGFERNDPGWHCRVEIAETVEEVLGLMRDYIATIPPRSLARLPEPCRALRVKAEDDIEYWTIRLSQRSRPSDAALDDDVRQEVFNHFLHASMRIAEIHRAVAQGGAAH
jgi:hypothetical protein